MPPVPAIEQLVRRALTQTGYLWKLSQLELDIPDVLKGHVTTALAKKAEWTAWSFESVKNQDVKKDFFWELEIFSIGFAYWISLTRYDKILFLKETSVFYLFYLIYINNYDKIV